MGIIRNKFEQYQDFLARIFSAQKMVEGEGILTYGKKDSDPDNTEYAMTKTVTFQVTDACNLQCTYCYQINKGKRKMTFETAKKFFDLLVEDSYIEGKYTYLGDTPAIIIEFIGGEPLLEIDLIDEVCDYIRWKLISENHPWAHTYMISMISNGVEYFNPKVQNFLEKNRGRVSFGISLDGCKPLHDMCRVFPDGQGSYDIAEAGCIYHRKHYDPDMLTKMTICPENLSWTFDAFVNLQKLGYRMIHANCVYEEGWNVNHATVLYNELKRVADYILSNNLENYLVFTMFDENHCQPMPEEDNNNYCGSTGCMLACDPDGNICPCIRFMKSSLGEDIGDFTIGHVRSGMGVEEQDKKNIEALDAVTRRSQSNDECWNCPVASGCGWCFPEGTLINTPNGYADIKDLKIGDFVIDSFGNTQKVINNFEHESKELVYVKASGLLDTLTTKEHPFYTRRFLGVKNNINTYEEKPEWVKAEELKVGDRIGLFVGKPGTKELPLDICYIIGRYIGDGWKIASGRKKHPYRYYLCCAKDERDELKPILESSNIVFSEFENKTVYEYKIGITSPYNLTDILDDCGRYAYNKKVPSIVKELTEECIKEVLRGYFDADGCFDKENNVQRFSSVSKELILGISELVRMVYHKNVNITFNKARVGHTIDNREINSKDSYEGRFMLDEPKRKYYEFDNENNIMWVNVQKSKLEVPEEETVYNLTVENTECYVANGAMVHNCTAYNYQKTGSIDKRCTYICWTHRAKSLANVYYWNKVYKKNNENKKFELHLPKDLALQIISEDEYNMLLELTK